MARTVKPPDVRRNEILDVAQRLFYTKGYRKTSVNDIIDEIDIAKGTFYHHFPSKQALLDALTDRVLEARSCKIFVMLTNAAMCWELVKNVAVMNHLPLEDTQVVEMPIMQVFDPYKGSAYYWNYQTRHIGIPNWISGEISWCEWGE